MEIENFNERGLIEIATEKARQTSGQINFDHKGINYHLEPISKKPVVSRDEIVRVNGTHVLKVSQPSTKGVPPQTIKTYPAHRLRKN